MNEKTCNEEKSEKEKFFIFINKSMVSKKTVQLSSLTHTLNRLDHHHKIWFEQQLLILLYFYFSNFFFVKTKHKFLFCFIIPNLLKIVDFHAPHTVRHSIHTHTKPIVFVCVYLFVFSHFAMFFFLQKTDFISNVLISYQHKS